jgi:hypothetical protein
MSQILNLKEIEKKAYRSTFEDGLYDICWGLLLIGFGISPLLREVYFPKPLDLLLLPIAALLTVFLGKKYITIPRLGFVKFRDNYQTKKKKFRRIAFILIPIQISLIILVRIKAIPIILNKGSNLTLPIIISIFIIIISIVIAHLINFPRFFIYGLFMAICYPAAEILHHYIETPLDGLIPFGISGIILLLLGLTYLIRFLNKYPKSSMEVTNEFEN